MGTGVVQGYTSRTGVQVYRGIRKVQVRRYKVSTGEQEYKNGTCVVHGYRGTGDVQ
jgi:hypothetical protein